MKNIQETINRLTAKILNETLEERANEIMSKIKSDVKEDKTEGEWMEIDMSEGSVCEQCGSSKMNEGECSECGYMREETVESLHGKQKKLDKNKNGKLDSEDFKMLRKSKTEESEIEDLSGEFDYVETDEGETEEGNAFTGALAKAKKRGDDEFEVDGETFNVRESKKSIQLTEEELIDVIEKLVKEETAKTNIKQGTMPKGLGEYKSAHNKSKKENDDYIKSVTKKLKDYLKDGSKGDYDMNPKIFPAGNGELKKMDKKAYAPSDAAQEYIDNFTAAGQENLVYDEIHPNEEWVTDNIEGSSRTGNNPKWANAVETPTNKKRNKIRKDNLLGQVKAQAYNKSPQPIVKDEAGESNNGGHMNLKLNKKANNILNQLESTNDKQERLIKEEFQKINRLVNYNKKTQ
jgi:ribosomal protein L32